MVSLTIPNTGTGRRPSSILRIKVVMERTGLTRPTLYRKMADGTFPRQVRISSNGIGWREDAVDAWLLSPMEYRADEDEQISGS